MQDGSAFRILDQTWKTSCFVWLDNLVANNDLLDQKHLLTESEARLLTALKTTQANPPNSVGDQTAHDNFHRLLELGLIVPASQDEGRKFSVKRVDIETCTHCNARCLFCPQSEHPKPKQFMSLELFQRAVEQIAPYRPDWVALNNFSEPFLDPLFVERCMYLEAHALKVALFTNATVLRPHVAEYLASSDVLHSITVNFPSPDPAEWANLMRLPASTHGRTVENIERLAECYKGGIGIVVNALTENLHSRIDSLSQMFARFPNVSVIKLDSNTLAGNIQNDLVQPASLTNSQKLGGCARLAAHVHISASGDVFMCCLDYWQETKFGNIADATLEEILGGDIAASHRRQVYGLTDADDNLLCRKCCHIRRAD